MNNKKQLILSIGLILVLVLMIVGISYAAFQFTGPGSKVNSITTGAITMKYTESTNVINMTGALPTTDETGKKRLNEGEYFDFTVSSTIQGNANINWEIALELMPFKKMFDANFVKVYLTELDDAGNETQVVEPTIFTNLDMDANEYTGKPARVKRTVEGIEDTIEIPILTLYSTSANKSFSKKYRLRIWVDESYNPQGDGGDLPFSIKINAYGKTGAQPSSLANQVLANNTVQETKAHMFNYTSEGVSSNDETDTNYITNGLYSAEDEDGTSYYFRGNVTNNYVQFGKYQNDYKVTRYDSRYNYSSTGNIIVANKGDAMLWRIVRVNGDGSVRLIYEEPQSTDSGLTGPFIGSGDYNSSSDNPKYTGYTYDNGTDSEAKKVIDNWYNLAFGNSVYDKMVVKGRFCSDSSGYKLASEYGSPDTSTYWFSSYDRLFQNNLNFAKDNAPTLKCPTTNETFGGSYRLKAGLITGDELTLAGIVRYFVSNENFYLYNARNYWTMTPLSYGRYGAQNTFNVYVTFGITGGAAPDSRGYYRPVINVSKDAIVKSGDGTKEKPYILSGN